MQAESHAAMAAAEAERNVRAEAEGLTETLRQDQERRARVFNNAVKAAVGKVQRELEAERDELQVGRVVTAWVVTAWVVLLVPSAC